MDNNEILANENEIYIIENVNVNVNVNVNALNYKSFTYKFGYKYDTEKERYAIFHRCYEYEEMSDTDKVLYENYYININSKDYKSYLKIHLYYLDNKDRFDKILNYPIKFSLNHYYDDEFQNLKVDDYDGNRLYLFAGLNGLQLRIDYKMYNLSKFNYKTLTLESKTIILNSLYYIKNTIKNDYGILSFYISLLEL